jgi:hypothetical protein
VVLTSLRTIRFNLTADHPKKGHRLNQSAPFKFTNRDS